jgi:integrase
MAKSTRTARGRKPSNKPAKPHPDFPLFPHDNGRWAKKVKGKLRYFGKWADDPRGEAALNLWLDEKDDLLAGRIPRAKRGGLTVKELCDRFCGAKDAKVESGELSPATFRDYLGTAKRIANFFGRQRLVEDLRGDDFDKFRAELAKTNGLVGLTNQITMTRMVFNYAYKAGLIDRPIHFGANFSRPSKKAIRKQRTPRMYEAAELRRMIDRASPTMKAMILLGANCGFGCTDVGRLPIDAVDLDGGWVEFPRPKTGADRRVPLWPETIAAIREALGFRPKPSTKELKHRLFLTRRGGSWDKEKTRYLSEQFREFLQGIDQGAEDTAAADGFDPPAKLYRKGRGFYTLRHVFETIGGESCDQVAVDAIMGHERGDMAAIYRERISDERLRRVVDTVREWLFADTDEHGADEESAIIPFRTVG